MFPASKFEFAAKFVGSSSQFKRLSNSLAVYHHISLQITHFIVFVILLRFELKSIPFTAFVKKFTVHITVRQNLTSEFKFAGKFFDFIEGCQPSQILFRDNTFYCIYIARN